LIVVKSIGDLKREPLNSIGFVPTMGALHAGHLSLIERAKQENDRVVVSVFVNPTQFGPNEDLSKYPRPFERDCELAEKAGADIIFSPSVEEIYPTNPTMIHVPIVTHFLEGEFRPGHFDGVATIVSKLFNIVQPTRAYFGLKDLQQCAVIRKLVKDLNHAVELIFCDTVRELDGLAMSSRNAYLSQSDREIAPQIYRILRLCQADLLNHIEPKLALSSSMGQLLDNGFEPDYFALVDWNTMSPTEVIDENSFLVVAARLGTTRLIDNLKLLG
jgi:pantoate--beta-alanine ligase